ncbi:V-type ATP synthase subunit A [Sedimenticola selenatireducens]|uniref:V-type ATP synthase alpha chain n=1 Tax=Sedimenticola selenatireducens TaxID=191960 RepID=A0A557RY09_9GAMM|nr:V-type ATP synthase subunit A [Sedimenticola selenatireducens]TVO70042.1 V-type ATP synthase subunit A [Sedimenticola selenatireducens]TVT61716.1 MAG: V-type ATP synthase subunit A [Sedimenticola selenatireducens]
MSETDNQGTIREINGPILTIQLPGIRNGEQVKIGNLGLYGEVIALKGEIALVQSYESTEGVKPGEQVFGLGKPLSVELGPGLLGSIFDGVQRPLDKVFLESGDHIGRGINLPALNRERTWHFVPEPGVAIGAMLSPGQLIGRVQETAIIEHRIMVPPNQSGELLELAPEGDYQLDDPIGRMQSADGKPHKLMLYQHWPVRSPRPYRRRDHGLSPLITGQRILDTFFPLLKGGKSAIPGPFGAGKTVLQQQIARWSNADIVIYVGCGERGNELVDVLETFPQLQDPYSGHKLMERTLLVANTSNMPVVAREASIYVGITMAEYYRDQGYDVVMLADSTSRWAEALREVSGRLGQMPVEDGYPAYLSSRLAAFYERAGRVETQTGAKGSVTLIGAVSPPGGDFSEPVTAHTKEIIQTFWALSKELADARHYPSIDWVGSFSEHVITAAQWWHQEISPDWAHRRKQALGLLARDAELSRIVNLVGPEALSSAQRWELEGAAMIKEGVLQQSALDPVDTFASPEKQFLLLDMVLMIFDRGSELIELGISVQELTDLPLMAKARRAKQTFSSDQCDKIRLLMEEFKQAFSKIRLEYAKFKEHTQ